MILINTRAEGDKNLENNPEFNGSNAIFLKSAFKKPIQSQRFMVIANAKTTGQKKPHFVSSLWKAYLLSNKYFKLLNYQSHKT
jgi:hypothetical protein